MTILKTSIAGFAAIAATVVTLAAATPLRAQTVSVPVAYGDLDLASPAGARELKTRIRRAATAACGQNDKANAHRVRACRRDAIASAEARVAQAEGVTVLAAR